MKAKQIELFGTAELAQPAKPPTPWPPAVPERVRRHLGEMLAEAQRAQFMPWPERRAEMLSHDFEALTGRLPSQEEASCWRARWEAELARLRRADAA